MAAGDEARVKEYRLDLKIRNNLILQRMEEAGYKTVTAFCRATGLDRGSLDGLLKLRKSPMSRRQGDWLPVVRKIADALGVLPEELFTGDQIERPIPKNVAEMRIDAHDLMALGAGELPPALPSEIYDLVELRSIVDELLTTLTPREADVLRRRFGIGDGIEYDLEEVGKAFNVSRERIRQIESKALRKLRHPRRAKMLRPYLDRID